MVVEIVMLKLKVCPAARVTDDGIGEIVIDGSTLAARSTVPAKPSTLWTLIEETPSMPGLTQRTGGDVLRAKSGAWA